MNDNSSISSLVPTEVATSFVPSEYMEQEDENPLAIEPIAGLVPAPDQAAAGNGGLGGGGVSPFGPVAAQQNVYMRDERQQALHQHLHVNVQQNNPAEARVMQQEVELEAERRHHNIMNSLSVDHREQLQAIYSNMNARDMQLRGELAAYQQELSNTLQRSRERDFEMKAEYAHMRTALVYEAEENKRENQAYLSQLFETQANAFKDRVAKEFVAEQEMFYRKHDELQDELAAANRSLKMEQDARSARGPSPASAQPPEAARGHAPTPEAPRVSAPSAPSFSDPFQVPESMRGLFANYGTHTTSAAPPGVNPSQPAPEGTAHRAPTPEATRGREAPPPAAEVPRDPNVALQEALAKLIGSAHLTRLLAGSEGSSEEKPKVKEAETVKLPDFPNPESYRAWKTATRESIRAASDQPDAAFDWVLQVYNKDTTIETLRDPGKFVTLDTKILASLSKISKGELARQVLNFKEKEAVAGRAVRGRQVLYLFEQYFKTNEEVGSLYSVEDLLKVRLHNDDLSTFIHNWESVISGMHHIPDEVTQRDIILRELRKSNRLKYDLEAYDRAKEGSETHSLKFLVNSVKELLTRERMRSNRAKIAKSHGDKYGAPAHDDKNTRKTPGDNRGRDRSTSVPAKGTGKGKDRSRSTSRSSRGSAQSRGSSNRSQSPNKPVCWDFRNGKCTRGSKCKFLHTSRSPSPAPRVICNNWKAGKCTYGSKCKFLHQGPQDGAAKDSTAAAASDNKKARSPSPAARKRKPRGGRGRSSSRDKDKKTSAVCCLPRSFAAAATVDEPKRADPEVVPYTDSWEVDFKNGVLVRKHSVYRHTLFAPDSVDCPIPLSKLKSKAKVEMIRPTNAPHAASKTWDWRAEQPTREEVAWIGKTTFKIREDDRRVRFSNKIKTYTVDVENVGYPVRTKDRSFSNAYLEASNCPRPDEQDARYSRDAALKLERAVRAMLSGEVFQCGFDCDFEDGLTCEHCGAHAHAAVAHRSRLEFLADTGSEEDLVGTADAIQFFPDTPPHPASREVNLITANGAVMGSQTITTAVPEFGKDLEFYVLDDTPPVCSVGKRCMEDGFGFYWPPFKAPYFVSPSGERIKCTMRGKGPVIGGSEFASPAPEASSRTVRHPVFIAPAAEGVQPEVLESESVFREDAARKGRPQR